MTQRVAGLSYAVPIRPTISSGAYAAKDVVGGILTIDTSVSSADTTNNMTANSRGRTIDSAYTIQSITVIDESASAAELVLVFFDTAPTTGVTNDAAFDPDDDELHNNCLGIVTIATTDYKTFTDNCVATVRNVGLQLKTKTRTGNLASLMGDDRVYCVAYCTGTPTFGATDALSIKFHLAADL